MRAMACQSLLANLTAATTYMYIYIYTYYIIITLINKHLSNYVNLHLKQCYFFIYILVVDVIID